VLVEEPKGAERGGTRGVPSPPEKGSGREIFLLFDRNMEHFGAVFKLDLTEETRTQLQENEEISAPCDFLFKCAVYKYT